MSCYVSWGSQSLKVDCFAEQERSCRVNLVKQIWRKLDVQAGSNARKILNNLVSLKQCVLKRYNVVKL